MTAWFTDFMLYLWGGAESFLKKSFLQEQKPFRPIIQNCLNKLCNYFVIYCLVRVSLEASGALWIHGCSCLWGGGVGL